MKIQYSATSLEDIAKAFDEREANAAAASAVARKTASKSVLSVEADTWAQAAQILRSTTLLPAPLDALPLLDASTIMEHRQVQG